MSGRQKDDLTLASVPYPLAVRAPTEICAEPECGRPVYADGLCKTHRDLDVYRRERRREQP